MERSASGTPLLGGTAAGIDVRAQVLRDDDFLRADEAFLTSTTRELLPIATVDDRKIGDGKPGPVTLKLLKAFRAACDGGL